MVNFQDTIEKLLLSDTGDLTELAKIAGKDPTTFYIDADFKRCDLSKQNLTQLDTRYADFSRAKLPKIDQALWEIRKKIQRFKHAESWEEYADSNIALGAILKMFTGRAEGEAAIYFLEETVSAYRAALTIYTKDQHGLKWAGTQNNFAIALAKQFFRSRSEAKLPLLEEAFYTFRAPLNVFTNRPASYTPVGWAETKLNFASTFSNHAYYIQGEAGAAPLAEAVSAYQKALTVYTKEQHPLDWAETKANLAIAELVRARHDGCQDPRPHLEAALAYADEALTVFDPTHMAASHAKTSQLREHLLKTLND